MKYLDLKDKIEAIQNISSHSKMSIQKQLFSKEVDFEMFEKHFWGKSKGSIRISAINAWTEIFTIIKGNYISYYTTHFIIPWLVYKDMKSSMDYLEDFERHHLYLIYVKSNNFSIIEIERIINNNLNELWISIRKYGVSMLHKFLLYTE